MTDASSRTVSTRRRWRVWCPECGRPCGRHQWGANRGKPIVAQHPRPGASMPRGLRPAARGDWTRANACPGSLGTGRAVTPEEEAAIASESPTRETLRRLGVFEGGEAGVEEFRRAMRGRPTPGAARRALAHLVDIGLLVAEVDGETSRLWRLTAAGEALLARASEGP